ncbi:dispanin subfamily A member 2b-like [Acipenser oxyrinchus oxyrinchus]|uniref:Dispanin subfamily A member 2b-like n=1 Tax=Acipenser oxyrinchus oxyrinchus TaxID=40147 RepID=A0AAD8CZP2_ACIOX|nr:dispanin subfamily A member 2b-like [Acipenser oxyrinchus oxyrinchus]
MDPAVSYSQNDCKTVYSPATVIEVGQDPTLVKDYVVWSIFNLVNMNCCCLGLVALFYSVKSRDQKHLKNLTRARDYGETAKRLNIASTVISAIAIVIILAIYVTTIIAVLQNIQRRP